MKKAVKKPNKTVAASKAKKPEAKKPVAKPSPTKAKVKTPEKKPLVKASPEKSKAPAPVVKKAAPAPAPVKKDDPKKPAPKIEAKKELQDRVVSNKKDAPKAGTGAAANLKGASKAPPAPIKVEPKIIETSQVEYVRPNLEEQLFTDDELKIFRELLDTERNKILQKARKAMEEGNMQFAKDDMMDEVDQASAMIEQNLTFRLLDRDRKLLGEIDHAINKIETGEYGYCEGTGEPIPKRRLELRPWCRHSVKYKEKLERMKKSGRGVVDEDEM